jgi:hypothetical protein
LPEHPRLRREQQKQRRHDGPNGNRKSKTKNESDKRPFKIRIWKLQTAAIDAKMTLQKLKKECVRIGANLDLERWDITAPEGHVFNATQCHYIVFQRWKEDRSPRWANAFKGWNKVERSAAYKDALARLKLGFSPDPEPS